MNEWHLSQMIFAFVTVFSFRQYQLKTKMKRENYIHLKLKRNEFFVRSDSE